MTPSAGSPATAISDPQSSCPPSRVPPRQIAVIGGGWYGCHLATTLRSDGHEVHVFEAQNDIFQEASGHTQNRLHLGYHYARSAITRREAAEAFAEFKKTYPSFSTPLAANIYAVPKRDSILDAETYAQVMTASGLDVDEIVPQQVDLRGCASALAVKEEVLHTDRARTHFRTALADSLHLNAPVDHITPVSDGEMVHGERFDHVVDCTWATRMPRDGQFDDVYFEPCVTFTYRSDLTDFALTLVDGPFFSVYPFRDGLYTLTSVPHTPLGRFPTHEQAQGRLNSLTAEELGRIRCRMEDQVMSFWPRFHDEFAAEGYFLSVKTKMVSGSDARVVSVRTRGRRTFVFAGKVSTVFTAARQVQRQLCVSS
ncbi:FAD-dependent oxidoreductase (plasmid) [Streptomyces sp. CA-142005]|uniref:FAD-dependent oxidoreductase n=1 Tax=Streptomyces sp. CA-142005 TaxID=3240052 RepID=UPI003D8D51E3